MSEELQQIVQQLQAGAAAQRIARVYAEALLDESLRLNAAKEVQEELTGLLDDIAGTDALLRNFFLGGVVGRGARKETLQNAFGGRVSDLFLNFLLVLNDHDRLELLRPISAAFKKLLEERSGQVPVRVASAVPLSDEYQEQLLQRLREMSGKEPLLEMRVDPELLGGLVVRVGDYLYDASVRSELADLRNQLVERSSHAIQTGRDRFSTAV